MTKYLKELKDKKLEDVVRIWFYQRFQRLPSDDLGYFQEWLGRFNDKIAIRYMDAKSEVIWNQLAIEHKLTYIKWK